MILYKIMIMPCKILLNSFVVLDQNNAEFTEVLFIYFLRIKYFNISKKEKFKISIMNCFIKSMESVPFQQSFGYVNVFRICVFYLVQLMRYQIVALVQKSKVRLNRSRY